MVSFETQALSLRLSELDIFLVRVTHFMPLKLLPPDKKDVSCWFNSGGYIHYTRENSTYLLFMMGIARHKLSVPGLDRYCM